MAGTPTFFFSTFPDFDGLRWYPSALSSGHSAQNTRILRTSPNYPKLNVYEDDAKMADRTLQSAAMNERIGGSLDKTR